MRKNINLPIDQPPGENFFVASIEIHSDEDPCWNKGFTIMGTWEVLRPLLAEFLLSNPLARFCSISVHQGDNARLILQSNLRQEIGYQQQKLSQGSN